MATSAEKALEPEKTTIRHIALRWAQELDCNAPALELAMYRAILDGEFDALPNGKGALSCDPTGKNWSTTGAIIRRQLERLDDASEFHRFALDTEMFGLHKDAVLNFAEKRSLMPPSWWAPETPPPPQKSNVSLAALHAFLKRNADGQLKEADLLKRAEEYFDDKIIRRQVWRTALARVPQNQKRRRGVARAEHAPT